MHRICQEVDLGLEEVSLSAGRRNDGYSKTFGRNRWHLLVYHDKICLNKSEDTSVAIVSLLNGLLGIQMKYKNHHPSAHYQFLLRTVAAQEEQRTKLGVWH